MSSHRLGKALFHVSNSYGIISRPPNWMSPFNAQNKQSWEPSFPNKNCGSAIPAETK